MNEQSVEIDEWQLSGRRERFRHWKRLQNKRTPEQVAFDDAQAAAHSSEEFARIRQANKEAAARARKQREIIRQLERPIEGNLMERLRQRYLKLRYSHHLTIIEVG